MFVQAIMRGYGCVYVCQSSSTKSIVDSYVYVMEALLEVLTRGVPRNVCEFFQARSSMGISACLSSSLSSTDTSGICIRMLTPLNYCDYRR